MKKIIFTVILSLAFCSISFAEQDATGVKIVPLGTIVTSDTFTIEVVATAEIIPIDLGQVSTIFLKSHEQNSGLIRVGGSWVKSTSWSIATGDVLILAVATDDIYVKTDVDGNRVEYLGIR